MPDDQILQMMMDDAMADDDSDSGGWFIHVPAAAAIAREAVAREGDRCAVAYEPLILACVEFCEAWSGDDITIDIAAALDALEVPHA